MFSVLERYILKEIFQTLLGVSFVLLIIVVSVSLVRYLGDAASGDIPSNLIFTLITLKGLKYFFTLILPISLYLAFLLALGRLYRDNEMVAINAAGIGPGKLFKIAVMVSLPLTVLSMWVMLFVVPKTVLIGYQIVDNASQKMEVTGLSASRFKEVGGGRQVIYVEEISEDRKIAKNVFIYLKQNNRDIVFSAAVSKITHNEIGERYLVLVNGYRYDGTPGEADYRTSYYKEHAVKLISNVEFSKSGKRDWVPTRELLKSKSRNDIAELQWRISLPLSAFFLSLFAIPIGDRKSVV